MDNLLINSTETSTTSAEVSTVVNNVETVTKDVKVFETSEADLIKEKESAEAAATADAVTDEAVVEGATDEAVAEGEAAVDGAIEGEAVEGEAAVDGAVEGEAVVDEALAETPVEGEVIIDDGTVMPGIDEGMDMGEGVSVDPGLGTGSTDVKNPLLSSWFFVIGISAAVLAVSIVLGVLLARRKIKKGIELYED